MALCGGTCARLPSLHIIPLPQKALTCVSDNLADAQLHSKQYNQVGRLVCLATCSSPA